MVIGRPGLVTSHRPYDRIVIILTISGPSTGNDCYLVLASGSFVFDTCSAEMPPVAADACAILASSGVLAHVAGDCVCYTRREVENEMTSAPNLVANARRSLNLMAGLIESPKIALFSTGLARAGSNVPIPTLEERSSNK